MGSRSILHDLMYHIRQYIENDIDSHEKSKFLASMNQINILICHQYLSDKKQQNDKSANWILEATILDNETICWKEQPQEILEAIIVPILQVISFKYDEKKATNQKKSIRPTDTLYGCSLECATSVLVRNQKHAQALADYIWQAMEDTQQYPSLEQCILDDIDEKSFRWGINRLMNRRNYRHHALTYSQKQNLSARLCLSQSS